MAHELTQIWNAVHAALLDELQFRAGPQTLAVEPDQLSDLADHLADVVIARFEISPRPRDLKREPWILRKLLQLADEGRQASGPGAERHQD